MSNRTRTVLEQCSACAVTWLLFALVPAPLTLLIALISTFIAAYSIASAS